MCNKGDACSFIHSGIDIPPTSNENLVSTPALTSHTTDSDEIHEIDSEVQTAQTEIHIVDRSSDPEAVRQPPADDSQALLVKSIPLPTSSDEECGTKKPQADPRTAFPYVEPVFSSHSLDDVHEDSRRTVPQEQEMRETLGSFPSNMPLKDRAEEKIAPADGELHELYHSELSPEGHFTIAPYMLNNNTGTRYFISGRSGAASIFVCPG